jgi:hypothetical protein
VEKSQPLEGNQDSLIKRQCAFLKALFDETAAVVSAIDGHVAQYHVDISTSSALALKFRAAMSSGMTFASHGQFRVSFYRKVVQKAQEVGCLYSSRRLLRAEIIPARIAAPTCRSSRNRSQTSRGQTGTGQTCA